MSRIDPLPVVLLATVLPLLCFAQPQTREEKVREDRRKVESEGFWIYNDLPQAFSEAKRTGKPLLVVLRCIPCEECVKLDDDLIDRDPVLRPLLEQFICVRQVSTNGLNLELFQFDTDQSFAVFLLNAEGTIYGRFGTRSHRTQWLQDVSLTGLAKALRAALNLHANYPEIKSALAGKRGEPMEVASPEKYPSLAEKYTETLSYDGNVVQSCIHCHQIGDAQREWYRDAGKPIPESVLFPYPHPKSIGLILDPEEMATVKDVKTGSAADKAGLQPGDRIEQFDGQPMLSIADVQWVLHNVDAAGGDVPLQVKRNDERLTLMLSLQEGWRRAGDLSWRATSWALRRMVTGGLMLETLPPEEREKLDVVDGSMALRVIHVGQYGAHAAAKKAGFQKGDVIVEYGGRRNLTTESSLLAYGVNSRSPGERVDVTVIRNGERRMLQLPIQD